MLAGVCMLRDMFRSANTTVSLLVYQLLRRRVRIQHYTQAKNVRRSVHGILKVRKIWIYVEHVTWNIEVL